MRRFLLFLLIAASISIAGCWDSSNHPLPFDPGTEHRLFNSSINSANNKGHGYFIISVPAPEANQGDEQSSETGSETEDGSDADSEPEIPSSTYAMLYIGRYASDDPMEFFVESTLEAVTMTYTKNEEEVVLTENIGRDQRAFFRFEWSYGFDLTYEESRWILRSNGSEIMDIRLEDGENISISSFSFIPDDSAPDEEGTVDALPYPEGMQLEAVYNYFEN